MEQKVYIECKTKNQNIDSSCLLQHDTKYNRILEDIRNIKHTHSYTKFIYNREKIITGVFYNGEKSTDLYYYLLAHGLKVNIIINHDKSCHELKWYNCFIDGPWFISRA